MITVDTPTQWAGFCLAAAAVAALALCAIAAAILSGRPDPIMRPAAPVDEPLPEYVPTPVDQFPAGIETDIQQALAIVGARP